MSKGARNLILLGVLSIFIAGITTAISVALYHYSGDIYLDRSRPGFLPDRPEEKEDNIKYVFQDDGPLDNKTIDEYLENFTKVKDQLIPAPFSSDPLTDESLGIPIE